MSKNEIKKYKVIILSSQEAGEYNRIYTVLSKERGRFSFLGVGVRKPQAKLAPALEPITKSEVFLIKGKRMPKVVGVLLKDQFLEIKKNLEKIFLVQKVFSLIKKGLPEEEKCDSVFNALEFYLKIIDRHSKENFLIEVLAKGGLIWKILEWNGRIPEIFKCFSCQKKASNFKNQKIFFSIPEGLVCDQCQKKLQFQQRIFRITPEVIKLMRLLGKVEQLIKRIRVKKSIAKEALYFLETALKD